MKALILMAFIMTNSYANTRVESVITEDASAGLNKIELIQESVSTAKKDLAQFENDLKNASKVDTRRKVFVVIRNTAAVTAAISLALTGTLLYKSQRPSSEAGLYNLIGAYGGAVITGGAALVAGGAQVGVYFSKNEAESLRLKIKELQNNLDNKQKELKTEIKKLCKDDPRHRLCY